MRPQGRTNSPFQPLRLHSGYRVDADLLEPPGTQADELVRRPGRDHDDLPCSRLDRLLADGEADPPALNDEGFFVGMQVQLGARPGRVAAEEERHA
jgi:hypothetical protein